ncbi:MAG: hemolysin family protein [SAR202 cluster bacterium]|nr:hemolysin family protein [SAR202 cluster bacterium]
MDTSDVIRLVLLGLTVLLSAFFAGSEAAFLSVQRSRLAALILDKVKGAERVEKLASNPEKLLPTVLTGNNLVNVAAAALGTTLAGSYLSPNWAVGVSVGAVTVLLLLFGEILPKVIATKNAEGLALILVRPLQAAQILFFPIVWVLEIYSRMVGRIFGLSGSRLVSEREIRALIDVAEIEGGVEKGEAALLEKVFHFGDLRVGDVMTPRTEIIFVELSATLQDFLPIYARTTYTRFPVFDGDRENIVGILSVKDLLEAVAQGTIQLHDSVATALRPAHFVPETKPVDELFDELREVGQHMAITVNEHGGVAGVVTLMQLLEVIVGPVGEEGEPIEEEFVAVGQSQFDVLAAMSILEANENLDIDLPEGDYQTLAGFVLEQLGHIPQEGESFRYGEIELEVKEMQAVKVHRVEVRILRS